MNDHVFVSYTHPDADFVLSLAENLRERGIIVLVRSVEHSAGRQVE